MQGCGDALSGSPGNHSCSCGIHCLLESPDVPWSRHYYPTLRDGDVKAPSHSGKTELGLSGRPASHTPHTVPLMRQARQRAEDTYTVGAFVRTQKSSKPLVPIMGDLASYTALRELFFWKT